ncbi:gliding motility-associated C-terminal domain-containing protein [Algoriphagus aestuariicola]|uniref:Gliding motility-associated C-terminal domain-containing protein n=1 Tax=Algoriphagus aestuariicola TaxID=1852016 RepID=A0ABS3BS80_9BACT|nr:PKD domain-containing protein [Algoriphagus aestuariicola]MBN7800534.1 gliding motility-associated C-terminal domain-containing protein [Algoriphagus aestuariicola]
MTKKLLRLLLLFFMASASFSALGQISTVGKEFWVGFMENNRVNSGGQAGPGAPDFAVLVVTANENTTGAIEYLGQSLPFSLNAGQQFAVRVPSQDLDLLHRNSGVVENKGIHITATGNIAVHAFNERVRSADGTVVLPVGALGRDYYVTSHFELLTAPVTYDGNINNESLLLVVATEDNTEIEITTSVNTVSGNQANVPSTITLNRGQSYQIKARGDLTGSRVRVIGDNADECKKIAVFGGNKWTSVGNCGEANDHLFQQAYPVNTWGTSFVHVGLLGRSSGELVKVLAAEDGTEVFVNGNSRGTVNQGEFLTLEFNADESGKIDTSKPSSVSVLSKSMACNNPSAPGASTGDPFIITYSPSEQFLTNLTFNSIDLPSIVNHYVNVVVKTGTQNGTVLDGQNIGNQFSALPGDASFQFARINISRGVHSLRNPDGFAAYSYGFGELESYGYAAGAALDNLKFEAEVDYDFEVEGEKIACLNHEGIWALSSTNPDFTYFVWDFGDSSPTKTGQEVPHTFNKAGTYEVKVLAALSPNSCEQQEEVTFEVEVIETEALLEGEQSVCPEVEQVMYRVSGLLNVARKEFEVEGGVIVKDYGDSVLVNWGPANSNAKIRLIPYSENGCPGAALELPVTINQRIVVGAASGELEVCFDPAVSHSYSAPITVSGRGYEWTVTGGQILSGQGGSEIEVTWDQPGIIGTVEYTAYSLVDAQCEGRAEAIQVKVAGEFVVETKTLKEITCSGDNSGSIALDVRGGVAPYRYEWLHDPALNSAEALGLIEGVYQVKVTDQLGCTRLIDNLILTAPEPLEILSLAPTAVSCYGKADGTVNLAIAGGVGPYTFEYSGPRVFSGQISLSDMPSGNYDWEVKDANGCIIPVTFEIISPIALEADVRLEKAACPGGSNGELFVLPKGGLGPFIYLWKDPGLSGNLVTGLGAGVYELEIKDATGCISVGRGVVREAAPEVRMPTGFDPRQSPGVYRGVTSCETNFRLWIYNRWGQLIYSGTEGWDGRANGEDAPAGTYTYLARYDFDLEGVPQSSEFRGGFTLIR